jgi:hypothetical protein
MQPIELMEHSNSAELQEPFRLGHGPEPARLEGAAALASAAIPGFDDNAVPALDEAEERPTIATGQVWRIAVPAGETRLSPRECKAIIDADAVIYESPLAAIVTAHRPLGGYVELASSETPGASGERCIRLARDGWRIVLLIEQRQRTRARREPPTILFTADEAGFSAPHHAVMANGLAG